MIHQITLCRSIVEKLGGVGANVVCTAQDQKLSRFVSLKFPPPEVPKEPQALQRFQREPLATSAFHQPNVNPGRWGGRWM